MSNLFEKYVRAAKGAELEDLFLWPLTDQVPAIYYDMRQRLATLNEYVDADGVWTSDYVEQSLQDLANLGTELAVALTGNDDIEAIKQHEHDVLLKKHHDYGPKNIADSPGGALNGLRVRLHDKLARLSHLTDTGAEPANESLADTALDIANYGTIAGMVLRGEWPGV